MSPYLLQPHGVAGAFIYPGCSRAAYTVVGDQRLNGQAWPLAVHRTHARCQFRVREPSQCASMFCGLGLPVSGLLPVALAHQSFALRGDATGPVPCSMRGDAAGTFNKAVEDCQHVRRWIEAQLHLQQAVSQRPWAAAGHSGVWVQRAGTVALHAGPCITQTRHLEPFPSAAPASVCVCV